MEARFSEFMKLAEESGPLPQTLSRRPEPSMDMDGSQNALDFNKSIETNIAANYAAVLNLIDAVLPLENRTQAIDLCSGPGHFAIYTKRFLGVERVAGIEISPRMNALAAANAIRYGYGKEISFLESDVREVHEDLRGSADLVNFVNSAHHMASLDDVARVLEAAEAYLHDDGVLVVSDLGRLKNVSVTEKFVKLAGSEFLERNMEALYQDFYNSMMAAWLPEELASAIPSSSKRRWFQFTTPGLRSLQALVAIPRSRAQLLIGQPAVDPASILISDEARFDWELLKDLYRAEAKELK